MTKIHTISGLKKLAESSASHKKEKYNVPEHAIPKTKYSDRTSNQLTKCIIDWCLLNGHFAERTGNEGRIIDQRQTVTDVLGRSKQIGSIKRIPSSGTNGTSDIKAIINGRMVAIEIKIGKDRQSPDQKNYQSMVERSGGIYFIAKDFQSFFEFMEGLENA